MADVSLNTHTHVRFAYAHRAAIQERASVLAPCPYWGSTKRGRLPGPLLTVRRPLGLSIPDRCGASCICPPYRIDSFQRTPMEKCPPLFSVPTSTACTTELNTASAACSDITFADGIADTMYAATERRGNVGRRAVVLYRKRREHYDKTPPRVRTKTGARANAFR